MIWFLKQLLPMSYHTDYGDEEGRRHSVVWHMWLGHCFGIRDMVIAQE